MKQQNLAVFDFDYTLTTKESLYQFLIWIHGRWYVWIRSSLLLFHWLAYLLGGLSRQGMKEAVLRIMWKGRMSLDQLTLLSRKYAEGPLNEFLSPQAMERVLWHYERGDRLILVSASLECYLIPWGSHHFFEKVLASRLQVEEGMIIGDLEGKNCWGKEKVRRLQDYLEGEQVGEIYVYGDSLGDRELLQEADHPYYRSFISEMK